MHIIRLGNNIGKEKRGNSQHVFLPFDDRNYHLLNGMPLHPSFGLDLRIFFLILILNLKMLFVQSLKLISNLKKYIGRAHVNDVSYNGVG